MAEVYKSVPWKSRETGECIGIAWIYPAVGSDLPEGRFTVVLQANTADVPGQKIHIDTTDIVCVWHRADGTNEIE